MAANPLPQSHVPEFLMRHVLTNWLPGVMSEPSGIVTSATNAALITQPGVAEGCTARGGGIGVRVAGIGVFVAGGGSVLTRIPLSGRGVSDGTWVGVPATGSEAQAASHTPSAMRNSVPSIRFCLNME
jgi:hypothetical protein